MPAGSNKKRERQYEHIKESQQERGVGRKRATEIAAPNTAVARRERIITYGTALAATV